MNLKELTTEQIKVLVYDMSEQIEQLDTLIKTARQELILRRSDKQKEDEREVKK